MGIAKKGTSQITVDGTTYRWVVADCGDFLDLVIEHVSGDGQRIAIYFDLDFGPITPSFVRDMITLALKERWTPRQRAKQRYLFLVDGALIEDPL